MRRSLSIIVVLGLACPATLHGQEQPEPRLDTDAAGLAGEYGAEGSRWWSVGLNEANDLSRADDWALRVGCSSFLVQDLEWTHELTASYHDQPDDNALGFGYATGLRWHLINTDPWTAFVAGEVGLQATTDVTPPRGGSFQFRPGVSLGATRRLGDSGVRLVGSVGWAHLSNARIMGEVNNPARDSVSIGIGIAVPF